MQNSKFKIQNCGKGFTLIELLISISIIGILAGFLLANFVGIRQRARDGVRKSDLRQIQSALELYRSDQGFYPEAGSTAGQFPACGSPLTDGGTPAVIYMKKIPCDPLNADKYIYTYFKDNNGYSLYSCLENLNDSQRDTENNTTYCTGESTNWSYTLTNP